MGFLWGSFFVGRGFQWGERWGLLIYDARLYKFGSKPSLKEEIFE